MILLSSDPDKDVIMQNTGDEELDEVERRLAAGEDPDEVFKDWGEGVGDTEAQVPVTEQSFEDQYDEFLNETEG